MTNETTGLARAIHTRLVAHAKELGVDPNLVLTRFAIERFLYRLSRSPYLKNLGHFLLHQARMSRCRSSGPSSGSLCSSQPPPRHSRRYTFFVMQT